MASRWVVSSAQRVRLFLTRFRRLPTTYWLVLASVFGVVDFLTWSLLSDVRTADRWRLTLGIAAVVLVGTVIFVLLGPSNTERVLSARSLTRLGTEAFNKADYPEALRLLEASARLDNDNAATWSLLGRTLCRLGRFAESVYPLGRGLELSQFEGNRVILLLHRYLAHYYLGNMGAALDDLNAIVRRNPSHSEALVCRATVWIQVGRLEHAMSDVESAIAKRPRYICAHALKVIVLRKKGKTQAAGAALRACEAIQPEDALDFYFLAMAYANCGKTQDALKCLQASVQQDAKCLERAAKEPLLDALRGQPGFASLVAGAWHLQSLTQPNSGTIRALRSGPGN